MANLGYHLAKYFIEAVTPYSVACFPTSYHCAGVRNKQGPLSCGCFNFATSAFASSITFDGTTFVNEPFGSGKLGENDELLPDLGLKYFNILLAILLNIDKWVAGPKFMVIFCKNLQ